MTIPYIDMPVTPNKLLTDIAIMIPVYMKKLGLQGNLREYFETPIPPHADVEGFRKDMLRVREDLRKWAWTYSDLTGIQAKPGLADESLNELTLTKSSKNQHSQDETIVEIVADFYMPLKLVTAALLLKLANESNVTDPDASIYYKEALQSSKIILKASAHVEKTQASGFDLLHCVGPLITLICCGPSAEYAEEGKAMLRRWTSKMGGLASMIDATLFELSPPTSETKSSEKSWQQETAF
jgi:hypothetical protein